MANKKYLVFDIGASGGKASISTFEGEKFILDKIYCFENRAVYSTEFLYWDVLWLFAELKKGIAKAVHAAKSIRSMSVDTWGCTFGFLDKAGRLISNPIHYRIKAVTEAEQDVYSLIPKRELFELTGGLMIPAGSIFRLFLLKRIAATEMVQAHRFLMMPDIFNYLLTRNIFNEFTSVTTTLLYDIVHKKWKSGILRRLGVSGDLFPVVLSPGTRICSISKDQSEEMGIQALTVVSCGSHDTASAVAGIPAIEKKSKWAFVSTGTWCIIGAETEMPVINHDVFEYGFGNEGGCFNTNLLVKNMTGFWILQKCREEWIRVEGRDITFEYITRSVLASKPLSSFVNVDESMFSYDQTDMPGSIRSYCIRSGQKISKEIGEVARCFFESLVMRFKYNLCHLEKLLNQEFEMLYIMGGGAKNSFFCQWIADLTGLEVATGFIESSSVGNFILQLKADGEINNLEEGREISAKASNLRYYRPKNNQMWMEAYSRYLNILKRLDSSKT